VAGTIGHAVEILDIYLYGLLAPILATLFFPQGNPTAALIATFIIFGAGYGMRVVGGFVLGAMGDRAGRRNTLALTILLIATGTLAIGLLPTYAQIGILAPILLFVCKAVQGFAQGGEFGSGASFLIEYAPRSRRAFYGSWHQWSVVAAILLGTGIVSLTTWIFSEEALRDWGWRVPFLVAAVAGLYGLYLRTKVADSPIFTEIKESGEESQAPLRETFRTSFRQILLAVGFVLMWTAAGFATYSYSTTFASTQGGLPLDVGTIGQVIVLACALVAIPFLGMLADRVGRKPLLIAGTLIYLVGSVPAYWLMLQGNLPAFTLGLLILGAGHAVLSSTAPAALAELFSTEIRASGVSQGVNFGTVLGGAFTPLIMTTLIASLGSPLAAPLWILATGVITLVVVLRMRETVGEPLR
jgi:MHS family proline/betaine transporter-like MFS transporter